MLDAKRLSAIWRRLISNHLGSIGLFILTIMVVVAVFAPLIAPYDPGLRVGRPFMPPDSRFWLGTNDLGNDILSEIIYGTRVSLSIGAIAASVAISIGTIVGLVSGYAGGKVDSFLMRTVDLLLVIPFLPLMILLAAYVGPSYWNIVLVIGLLSWARPARVVRSQVLSLRTRGYVTAARSLGAPTLYVIWHHILPGVLPLTLAQFVMAASHTILVEASLSFLGLGDPLARSWGQILYYAQARGAFLSGAWKWWVLPPGVAIAITVLGFAFTGYALEEIVNPRLRKG